MDADPKQVLRIIDCRDIDIRLRDGRLVARARSGQVPPDMISFIRFFKDLIISELQSVPQHKSTPESEVA